MIRVNQGIYIRLFLSKRFCRQCAQLIRLLSIYSLNKIQV
jgi:hypothetical protein